MSDFRVGDVVLVRNGEAFPADLILLTSSEVVIIVLRLIPPLLSNRFVRLNSLCAQLDGNAYVETANIDGETNLKLRLAIKEVSDVLQDEKLGDLKTAMKK